MKRPPFHAEHIGSFVRTPRLIDAARAVCCLTKRNSSTVIGTLRATLAHT